MAQLWADGLWNPGLWADDLWERAGVAPTITTTGVPAPIIGEAYDFTLRADGDPTIVWTIESGTLPDGLTLETDGQIHGTPTTEEIQNVEFRAENSDGFDLASFSFNVTDGSDNSFRAPIQSGLSKPLIDPLVVSLRE